MKKAISVVLVAGLLLTGCATIKKVFCSLDFNRVEAQLHDGVEYVDGIYWYYVNLLKDGNEEVRSIVVTMDLFLATAKPMLSGIQKGICYPQSQIEGSLNFENEIKERIEAQTAVKIL